MGTVGTMQIKFIPIAEMQSQMGFVLQRNNLTKYRCVPEKKYHCEPPLPDVDATGAEVWDLVTCFYN